MKKKSLCVLLCLTIISSYAQIIKFEQVSPLLPATEFIGGTYGNSLTFADIDNDLDMDLLIHGSSDSAGNVMRLYINDGNGFYSESGDVISSGNWSIEAIIVDYDEDNDLDIFNSSDRNFYINDGYGHFEKDTVEYFNEVSRISSPIFKDINGDGLIDYFSSGVNWNGKRRAFLYFKNSQGFFEIQNTPFDLTNWYVFLEDIDNDSDPDLFITDLLEGISKTRLYLNDGLGNFTLKGKPFGDIETTKVVFSDIDNDNDLDVLVPIGESIWPNNFLKFFKNDGQGNFTEFSEIELAYYDDYHSDIKFADLDSDTDQDLIYGKKHSFDDNIGIEFYLNNGTGLFTQISEYPVNEQQVSHTTLAFTDIDGDLDQDFIFASSYGGQYEFYTHLYRNISCLITRSTLNITEDSSYTVPSGDETYTLSGIYYDTIPNSCGADSIITINLTINTVGIDNNSSIDISIYPNPSDGIIMIEGVNIQRIEVFNFNGRKIGLFKVNNNQYKLDLKSYIKGIYIIKIISQNEIVSEKILIK